MSTRKKWGIFVLFVFAVVVTGYVSAGHVLNRFIRNGTRWLFVDDAAIKRASEAPARRFETAPGYGRAGTFCQSLLAPILKPGKGLTDLLQQIYKSTLLA